MANIFDSPAEREFAQCWETHYPEIDLHLHVRFHPTRRWSFDFAHMPSKTAIELDGFKYHTTYPRFASDREKDFQAALLGWQVIRLTPKQSLEPWALSGLMQLILKRQCAECGQ